MMEKLFRRETWLRIFSVALAVLLWAFVIQDLSAQTMTREMEVPLQVRHHASLKVYEGPKEDGDLRVLVRVEGSPLYVRRLQAKDMQAELDYSRVTEPGKTIQVEVKLTGPGNAPRTTSFTSNPKTVTAMLVEISEKQVPVTVQPISEVVAFQGKEYRYTATPVAKTAPVSGRSDFLVQVASALITLDPADKVPSNLRVSKPVTPLDAAGKPVDKLEKTFIDVNLEWQVLPPGKSIKVQPITGGTLPKGYVVTRMDPEPAIITMRAIEVGGKLPDIGFVETFPIDLTGRTKNFTTTARLPVPNGTMLSVETVNVAVTIAETTVEKVFKNVPIQVHGKAANLDPVLSVTDVEIRLKGPYTVVNALEASAVAAYVDVEGLGEGKHKLAIRVSRPQGVTEEFLDPPTVEVSIVMK